VKSLSALCQLIDLRFESFAMTGGGELYPGGAGEAANVELIDGHMRRTEEDRPAVGMQWPEEDEVDGEGAMVGGRWSPRAGASER
jgi:hypothetical protein